MAVHFISAFIACLLTAFVPYPGLSLEILRVSLQGGRTDYIEVGAKVDYSLNCEYRTPYDDPIKEVLWLRYGTPFYKWVVTGSPTVLDTDFLGLVDNSPEEDSHNIHFTPPLDYNLSGSYECQVLTAGASASATYDLRVVDGGSWPIVMTVQALSKMMEKNSSSSDVANTDNVNDNEQYKYEVEENPSDDPDAEVVFEDEDCTLVWSLSTPAIYPRPNVTCGHYSFDHEDVVQRLPAGLTLHKFPNGSWTAFFSNTHIQVASLPKNHRLGCSIRIPETSYKQVVRPQDDLWVESLIDTGGCPGLEYVQERGVIVEINDASYTCRGDVLPADRTGKALASLSCPEGFSGLFPNHPKRQWEGSLQLSCAENDIGWRRYDPEDTASLGDLINPDSLPVCVPGISGAECNGRRQSLVTIAVTLVLGWLFRV